MQHSMSGLSCALPSFHSVLLPAPPSALTCLLTALRTEGTFRHMDLPFVYYLLDRGVTSEGGWLLIGCGSSTLNQIGCDLAEGSGESMVWNLEETRDCWNSATKLYTDGLRHKSRYNGIPAKWANWEALPCHALCLPSLVYSTLQPLGLCACVYMCIYVSLQSVWEKARPRLPTKDETKEIQ